MGVGAVEFDQLCREVRRMITEPPVRGLQVSVKVLPHGEGLELPNYETAGAVGMDLRAAVPEGERFWIQPGEAHKIPTGLCVAIPEHYAGLVLSRSGLAADHQVAVTNSPGLIDPDFRGEFFVLLENRGPQSVVYRRGDRLAQLLVVPAPRIVLQVVDDLGPTDRGIAGLGSTGVSS